MKRKRRPRWVPVAVWPAFHEQLEREAQIYQREVLAQLLYSDWLHSQEAKRRKK